MVLLAATATQVYTTLQLPALMANIINNGIVPSNMDVVWQNGALMFALALLSAGAAFLASYFSAKIGAYFSRDLRAAIFEKVLAFNLGDIKGYSTASLITRTTNDVNQIQMIITMMLSMLMRAPLFCILGLTMAIQTAPEMSWIIVIGISAVLASAFIILAQPSPK